MDIDDDTKRFIIHRLKWSILYVGIGIVLVLVLLKSISLRAVGRILDKELIKL